MTDLTGVMAEAAAHGRGDGLIQRMAERLGQHASARAVFADPVERGGVTVIPVAKVRWGFGGGGGEGPLPGDGARNAGGEGGGGGVIASPVGYIEIRDGQARYERIVDPVSYWPLVLASAFACWLLLRSVRGLLRSK